MRRRAPWLRLAVAGLIVAASPGPAGDAPHFTLLDTEPVKSKVKGPQWVIVDVRDPNAFNGWPWDGEARGGHIPGAVNIALAWVERDRKGIKALLRSKGILGDRPVLLYGSTREQAARMADLLVTRHAVAASRLHLYQDGFPAWSAAGLPVDRLPRCDRLVPARWLANEMKTNPALRVFEVSWGKGEDYARGHLPGSVHINTDLFEAPPLWDIVPPAQLTRSLLSLGVTSDTPVVLYGASPMPSAFAVAVMLYAGVKEVRMLNGGFPAWTAEGLPVEKGENPPRPASGFGARAPVHPDVFTGIDTARRLLSQPNMVLVDVRSWKEHIGAVTGYEDIKARGRIPGTVWGHGGSDAMNLEDYRNPDNTMRDYQDIARFWADAGITPQKRVGFHCGTGWRASEAYLAAWLMGWENITIYDGGWYEWSNDPANPIARGDPRLANTEAEAEAGPEMAPTRGPYYFLAVPALLLALLAVWWIARSARRHRT